MLIGVIADDFTGASDIANTLAKGVAPEGGLTTAQFSGVPQHLRMHRWSQVVQALRWDWRETL